MNIKVTQITSSNQRPADHKDFKADVVLVSDVLPDETKTWEWIALYVAQGDRVIVERIGV